jgi:hypothetical protein
VKADDLLKASPYVGSLLPTDRRLRKVRRVQRAAASRALSHMRLRPELVCAAVNAQDCDQVAIDRVHDPV